MSPIVHTGPSLVIIQHKRSLAHNLGYTDWGGP